MFVKFFIIYIIPIIISLLYAHLSKRQIFSPPYEHLSKRQMSNKHANDKSAGIIRFLFPYKCTFINIITYIPLVNYNVMGSILSDIMIFPIIDWVESMVIIFKVRKIFRKELKCTDTLNTYMIEKKNGTIFILSNVPDGYVEQLCQSFKKANITEITDEDVEKLKSYGFKELTIKKIKQWKSKQNMTLEILCP